MPNGENGDEFSENGDYGEYGELEDLRELLEDRADDVEAMVLLDMGEGEGFVNVEIDGEWYEYDLNDFDGELWTELFEFLDELEIEYVVYER